MLKVTWLNRTKCILFIVYEFSKMAIGVWSPCKVGVTNINIIKIKGSLVFPNYNYKF